MAHNIEIVDGQAQMAYRLSAGVPWHGLGTPVGDDLTPKEIMKAAGLDWTVSKHKTYAKVCEDYLETGTQALVRDSDKKILTEVGEGWNPVQNEEAFDFFTDFVKTGKMTMDTAGSLQDGRIVWALADLKDGFDLFNGDKVNGYLLFSNPHKYGQSIDVKFCAVRVVCNNTLTMAMTEKGKPSIRINHRSQFDAEKVKEVLGLSHRKMDSFKEAAEFLGSKQFTKDNIDSYFGELFGLSEKEDKKLTRTGDRLVEIIETQPGAEFKPGSFWQLFNASTFFIDHEAGRSNDTRLSSAWFGQGAKKKLDALNLAVEMAA